MRNGILVIHVIKYLLSAYYIPDAKNTPNSHEHRFYIVNMPIAFVIVICHSSQTESMLNLLDKKIL